MNRWWDVVTWSLTGLGVVLIAGVLLAGIPAPGDEPATSTAEFARRFLHHGLYHGRGSGNLSSGRMVIDPRGLEPGDVIVVAAPECAFGHFGHAGLYLGDGDVLGQHVQRGTFISHVSSLAGWDVIIVLRPDVPAATRQAAADWGRATAGRPFAMLAHRHDPRWTNCSTICATAYDHVGIDLCPGDWLIVPDDLYRSERLRIERVLVKPHRPIAEAPWLP